MGLITITMEGNFFHLVFVLRIPNTKLGMGSDRVIVENAKDLQGQ